MADYDWTLWFVAVFVHLHHILNSSQLSFAAWDWPIFQTKNCFPTIYKTSTEFHSNPMVL